MFVGSEIPYTIMAKNRYCTSAVLWCRGFLTTQDGHKVNPSQKPLLQLEFLLRVCHQGGWVVDLCCGSGSGLIAGLRLGYNVAGFDILKSQVNATKARIRKYAEQEICSSKQLTQMLVKSLFASWVEPLLSSPVKSLLTYLVIAFVGRCLRHTVKSSESESEPDTDLDEEGDIIEGDQAEAMQGEEEEVVVDTP